MQNTVISLAELTAAHGRDWLGRARQADQSATNFDGAELALDFSSSWREPAQAGGATADRDAAAAARLIDFRGYAYTRTPSAISGGLVTRYDPRTPQIWRVPLRDQVSASLTAAAPLGGYVVPAAFAPELSRDSRLTELHSSGCAPRARILRPWFFEPLRSSSRRRRSRDACACS